MDDLLVVEVRKCSCKEWWYDKLINFELNVILYDEFDYALYGNPMLLISKDDVRVVGK